MKSKIFILFLSIILLNCDNKASKNKNMTANEPVKSQPFFKLSIAQWSLHKTIESKKLNPLHFASKAKEMGFEGVEYVNHLYKNEIDIMGLDSVISILKKESIKVGIQNLIMMVDGEGDLSSPNVSERNEAVENHKKWVLAAQALGCHSIRVNLFGTFEADEWVNSSIDGLTKLCKYADTKGIHVLVENHGWLSSNVPLLLKVIKKVNMKNCGLLPDFGNFCVKREKGELWGKCLEEYPDIYQGIADMMPYAKGVSAKSYDFDKMGEETKINYKKMLDIVKNSGFNGFIGVEYEGTRLSEEEGILKTKDLLLKLSNEKK